MIGQLRRKMWLFPACLVNCWSLGVGMCQLWWLNSDVNSWHRIASYGWELWGPWIGWRLYQSSTLHFSQLIGALTNCKWGDCFLGSRFSSVNLHLDQACLTPLSFFQCKCLMILFQRDQKLFFLLWCQDWVHLLLWDWWPELLLTLCVAWTGCHLGYCRHYGWRDWVRISIHSHKPHQ